MTWSTIYTLDGAPVEYQLPKFSIEKIVKADLERTFDVLTDLASLQKIIPRYFPSVRIRSTRGSVSIVEEHLVIAEKELVMMTKHVINRPHTHEVYVIGGDAKGSQIIERYDSVGQGTKITVNVDFKPKGTLKITGFFGKDKIVNDFSEILNEFALIAEN